MIFEMKPGSTMVNGAFFDVQYSTAYVQSSGAVGGSNTQPIAGVNGVKRQDRQLRCGLRRYAVACRLSAHTNHRIASIDPGFGQELKLLVYPEKARCS